MNNAELIDQEAEKQYDCILWSKKRDNMTGLEIREEYLNIVETGSANMMAKYDDNIVKIEVSAPYGTEVSYIFKPEVNPNNCMYVFIHGGYWTSGSTQTRSLFMADLFTKNGFYYAALSYKDTEPQAPLSELVSTVVKAVNMICDFAKSVNISSVIIAGHSAGGHLTTMLLFNSELSSLAREMIKGLIPTSGVFNVNNLLKTSRLVDHPYLQVFDSGAADELSPLILLRRNNEIILKNLHLILIMVGEEESPSFIMESELLYQEILRRQKVGDIGENCLIKNEVLKHTDHFNIISCLADSDSQTTQILLRYLRQLQDKL